jgi:hypothetical protein
VELAPLASVEDQGRAAGVAEDEALEARPVDVAQGLEEPQELGRGEGEGLAVGADGLEAGLVVRDVKALSKMGDGGPARGRVEGAADAERARPST